MSLSVTPTPFSPPSRSGPRRALRWLVPVAAAGVVALLASGVLSADAKPNLPARSAAQLLAAVGNAKVAGFSGTVVEKASLGLPELPSLGGGGDTTSPLELLTGSHTIRVWYAGENKQRVALLDSLGEQDVFRNGRELWQWNSDSRTASHSTLPSDTVAAPEQLPAITPDQAARQALAMIEPSTTVSTDRAAVVAGRAAYTLVLVPKDARSRISSVRISIDGKTLVPLGMQVYARGAARAAFDVAYTRFDDSVPSDDNFNWRPPAGATVKQAPQDAVPPGAPGAPGSVGVSGHPGLSTVGTGWTTVLKLTGGPSLTELTQQSKQTLPLLGVLPAVKGSWGSGRLFQSALISALITSDGRIFAGAVDPELLYQAAAAK